MTYESFLDNAMHGTTSSKFADTLMSLVMTIPLEGCHSTGATLAVA
jgi:hypothetical protein